MERRVISTARGELPLWGQFERFSAGRPVALAIRGAFATDDQFADLDDALPEFDVVVGNLPGMATPHLTTISIEAFAAAYDEAVTSLFSGRRIICVGASMGGLVALAMRLPTCAVALDPPLSTRNLWPLAGRLKHELLNSKDPKIGEWIDALFGAAPGYWVNRDYRSLLLGRSRPAWVLVAGEALEPPRPLTREPGLMTAPDRAWVSDLPNVQACFVPSVGHNLPLLAPKVVLSAIRSANRLHADQRGDNLTRRAV